jgi:hypothetical protein
MFLLLVDDDAVERVVVPLMTFCTVVVRPLVGSLKRASTSLRLLVSAFCRSVVLTW